MSSKFPQGRSPPYDENSPGEKTKKYDRQLRLWGDHGQAALEQARVCLVNTTATGTEILKNLILPGIGAFTIVDHNVTVAEDVGNNFFLDRSAIGKSRAQVATELLQELNEDVRGEYIEESVENLLINNPDFFNNFSVVIATTLPDNVLLRLASKLWESGTPLLVCRCYGFMGYMRLVVKEHTVVESHPDNSHEDLRLDQPFPALQKFCDSLNMDEMNKKDHSHTPWLVVIYKYLQKWKQDHSGEAPKNYKEKNQFKELVRQGMWANEEGVPENEENFDEAIRNVNSSLVVTKVPSEVQQIFNDDKCLNINSDSSAFWILARAVKEFVQKEGQGLLPLRGSIPDMTADSERYIQLQNAYKEQANMDVEAVARHLENILDSFDGPMDIMPDRELHKFCKNASFLRVLRGRSLKSEYDTSTSKVSDLSLQLEGTDDGDAVFYIMLRAVDRFYTSYSRFPGCDSDMLESDIPKLKSCLSKLLVEYGIAPCIKDEYVHEFCRYGAAELHSVAAFMGGSAAQEIIKVITEQFIPLNNTYIYNAMKQTSITVEL